MGAFVDNFDGASLDPRWAGSTATLDDPNNRADIGAGDLISIGAVLNTDDYNDLDISFSFIKTVANYNRVQFQLPNGLNVADAEPRVQVDLQATGGADSTIRIGYRDAWAGLVNDQTINTTLLANTEYDIRITRSNAGQWEVFLDDVSQFTSNEPAYIDTEDVGSGSIAFPQVADTYITSVSVVEPPPSRGITDIDTDNSVQAGQVNVTVTTELLDAAPTTQVATLGGEALTVVSWSASAVVVSIPIGINLEWGSTNNQLALTDDTGTVTLNDVTLLAASGWSTVVFSGTIPDMVNTESYYEEAITDLSYTMIAGDILAWEDATGLTVDEDTYPTISPPATVSGDYRVWDATLNTWSSTSQYQWTDAGAGEDIVAPVITVTGSTSIQLALGEAYVELGATWTDNVDGSGAATVGGDTVDVNTIGTYVVTYNYTDVAGNPAIQKTRTVQVGGAVSTLLVSDFPATTVNSANDIGDELVALHDLTRRAAADVARQIENYIDALYDTLRTDAVVGTAPDATVPATVNLKALYNDFVQFTRAERIKINRAKVYGSDSTKQALADQLKYWLEQQGWTFA